MTRHPAFLTVDDAVLKEEYVLEMFHRVVFHDDQDQEAKVEFQRQLDGMVLYWLRLHSSGERVSQREKEESYIVQTFERFWQMIAQGDATAFNTFATLVAYLRASLNSVIIDTIRAYESSRMPTSMLQDSSDEIWDDVQNLLSHPRQQRIASLLFHCGLKPGEIVQSYPEEFSDVLEIAHIRQKIFLLLRERVPAHFLNWLSYHILPLWLLRICSSKIDFCRDSCILLKLAALSSPLENVAGTRFSRALQTSVL